MERGFLSQKGSRVGRGVKEKQVSIADKSVEVNKHVSVANTSESFPTVSEAHGIPPPTNKENINNVGPTARPTTVTHGSTITINSGSTQVDNVGQSSTGPTASESGQMCRLLRLVFPL
ncbi:hypothetical protein Tco_1162436, partial [Tanacetum coccineum]